MRSASCGGVVDRPACEAGGRRPRRRPASRRSRPASGQQAWVAGAGADERDEPRHLRLPRVGRDRRLRELGAADSPAESGGRRRPLRGRCAFLARDEGPDEHDSSGGDAAYAPTGQAAAGAESSEEGALARAATARVGAWSIAAAAGRCTSASSARFDGEDALAGRRQHFVRLEYLAGALSRCRGGRGRQRPGTAASYSPDVDLGDPRVDVAADALDLEVGSHAGSCMARRRLSVPIARADGGASRPEAFARDQGVAGVGARQDGADSRPLGISAGMSLRLCTARSISPARGGARCP